MARIITSHRLARVAVIPSAAIALMLAACSGGPSPEQPTASATTATATATPTPATPSPTPTPTAVALAPVGDPTPIASGLQAPWSIAFRGDTALISERDTGDIYELGPATGGAARLVGTVPDVVAAGEGGLMGLAVDAQGRLYAASTGPNGNRVQRFTLTGAPGALALGSEGGGGETIIDGIPSARTHNGGRIAFGPDGMLYVTTGDAGQRDAAQDLSSLAGKILRMTPDGAAPADNPFAGSVVYSYGHRNPQGIAWSADGVMFAAEFGQDTWDELNIITAGANYGWPIAEGAAGDARFTDPVQQWPTDAASPSGIAIAGATLYIANLRGEVLRTVPVADPSTAVDYYVGTYGRLRDVAFTPSGTLWFLTNNTDGRGDPRDGDDLLLQVELRPG